METLYRKVKCSERLPDINYHKRFHVIAGTGLYTAVFFPEANLFQPENNKFIESKDVEYWLEEMPKVNVEEIEKILSQNLKIDGNRGSHIYWIDSESKITTAQAIHKLIYGEE